MEGMGVSAPPYSTTQSMTDPSTHSPIESSRHTEFQMIGVGGRDPAGYVLMMPVLRDHHAEYSSQIPRYLVRGGCCIEPCQHLVGLAQRRGAVLRSLLELVGGGLGC
jgi:hypothetical protein